MILLLFYWKRNNQKSMPRYPPHHPTPVYFPVFPAEAPAPSGKHWWLPSSSLETAPGILTAFFCTSNSSLSNESLPLTYNTLVNKTGKGQGCSSSGEPKIPVCKQNKTKFLTSFPFSYYPPFFLSLYRKLVKSVVCTPCFYFSPSSLPTSHLSYILNTLY